MALHVLPLARLLEDWGTALVGVGLTVALLAPRPRLRSGTGPTSAVIGVVMGASLLAAGAVAGTAGLVRLDG